MLLELAFLMAGQTPQPADPTPAATATSGASAALPFDITQILQFGLLGLIFLCIVFQKFLVPEWVLRRADADHEKDRAELERRLAETKEQLDRLQDVFQDRMIPALTRATEINARYNEELQRARYRRRDDGDDTGHIPSPVE